MESMGLAQSCAGFEGWQAEPGFWVGFSLWLLEA